MVALLLVVAGLFLGFRYYMFARQYRTLHQQQSESPMLTRLTSQGLVETVDAIFFACALVVLPNLMMQKADFLMSYMMISGVLWIWLGVRWGLGDLYSWCLRKKQGAPVQEFSQKIMGDFRRFMQAQLWIMPAFLIASLILEFSYPLICLSVLFLVLQVAQMFIRPWLQAQPHKTNVQNNPGRITIYEDPNAAVKTEANARALAGLGQSYIVYTPALKKLLNEDEFKSVLAHEKGHLKAQHHLKWVILKTILLSLASLVFYMLVTGSGQDLSGPVVVISALFGSYVFRLLWAPLENVILHQFEFEADRMAVQETGVETYTKALGKIWSLNKTAPKNDCLYNLFYSTHPEPSERLRRLPQNAIKGPLTSLS